MRSAGAFGPRHRALLVCGEGEGGGGEGVDRWTERQLVTGDRESPGQFSR